MSDSVAGCSLAQLFRSDLIPGYLHSSLDCHFAASPTVSTKTCNWRTHLREGLHNGRHVTDSNILASCRFSPFAKAASMILNVDSFANVFRLILSLQQFHIMTTTCELHLCSNNDM